MNEAKYFLNVLSTKYNIETELITLKELMDLYKTMPFTFHRITEEWKCLEHTVLDGGYMDKYNPNYGNKHSEETKRIIGEKSKERWEDPELREKMINTLRANSYKISRKLKGVPKAPREVRNCLYCNRLFEVIVTSNKKFCTLNCANRAKTGLGNEVYVKKRQSIHSEIKDFVEGWAKENKDFVTKIPYNKISTYLEPIILKVNERFGVKDFRVITKAVLNEDKGRKELLKYLKNL